MPAQNEYVLQLKTSNGFCQLNEGSYIMRDCDGNGKLKTAIDWTYLYELSFTDQRATRCKVLICSCKDSACQREALEATGMFLSISAASFLEKEKDKYCIHSRSLSALLDNDMVNTPIESDVVILSVSPHFVCTVFADGKYGIVSKGRSYFKCSCKVEECSHVRDYISWCEENDVEIPDFEIQKDYDNDIFPCKSSSKIPYPFPPEMKLLYDTYQSNSTQFPVHCIPSSDPDEVCEHGNNYDDRCPVLKGWLKTSCGVIHSRGTSLQVNLHNIFFQNINIHKLI